MMVMVPLGAFSTRTRSLEVLSVLNALIPSTVVPVTVEDALRFCRWTAHSWSSVEAPTCTLVKVPEPPMISTKCIWLLPAVSATPGVDRSVHATLLQFWHKTPWMMRPPVVQGTNLNNMCVSVSCGA